MKSAKINVCTYPKDRARIQTVLVSGKHVLQCIQISLKDVQMVRHLITENTNNLEPHKLAEFTRNCIVITIIFIKSASNALFYDPVITMLRKNEYRYIQWLTTESLSFHGI